MDNSILCLHEVRGYDWRIFSSHFEYAVYWNLQSYPHPLSLTPVLFSFLYLAQIPWLNIETSPLCVSYIPCLFLFCPAFKMYFPGPQMSLLVYLTLCFMTAPSKRKLSEEKYQALFSFIFKFMADNIASSY